MTGPLGSIREIEAEPKERVAPERPEIAQG
jgi:hypothetical protein